MADKRDAVLRKLRTGRLARMGMLGRMAAGMAGSAAGAAGKWVVASKDAAAEKLHRRAAEQIGAALGEMKGLPMKLGQLYSYLDGVVPPEHQEAYSEILGALRTKAQPMGWNAMAPVIEAELGPIDEAFAELDTEPIAAASIGQVYKAVTHDGNHVAVKVQYPGIAEAIASDLKNARGLIKAWSVVLPRVQVEQGLKDISARIHEECDYRFEMANQREFRQLWLDDTDIIIPEVYEDLTTDKVLTTALAHGRSFDEFLAEQPDQEERNRVGQILYRFVFTSLYEHGLFNADPHPGNYLFTQDGPVVFLDFGCVQRYDDDTVAAIVKMKDAMIAQVPDDELRVVLQEAMLVPDVFDDEVWAMFERYMRFCFEPVIAKQPFRFTREYTSQISQLTIDFKMMMAKKLLKTGIVEPRREGFTLLSRIIFGVASILAHLEAEADWRALV